MLWNSSHLYIAAELEEPHVWATLAQHDQVIFHDNDFEVFIDPDGDTHDYFEIEINALNTVFDLFLSRPYRNRGVLSTEWNTIHLKTAVHTEGTINNAGDRDQKMDRGNGNPVRCTSKQQCAPVSGKKCIVAH